MNKNGFTLVELIVVVTILSILSAIGFVSYNGYMPGVRDTNRVSQLDSMNSALQLYSTRENLPSPDNAITIYENQSSNTILGYQGKMGTNILDIIGYSKAGKDPKYGEYFTYALDSSRSKYQLMAFLEESIPDPQASIFPQASAYDYTGSTLYTLGQKVGILTTENTNTPVEDLGYSEIDLSGTDPEDIATYQVYFKNGSEANQLSSGALLSNIILSNRLDKIPYPPREGLVFELLFDDSANIGVDTSGNNYTATNNGVTYTASGRIGGAAVFDNSYLHMPPASRFQSNTSYTVSFWADPDGKSVSTNNTGSYIMDQHTGTNVNASNATISIWRTSGASSMSMSLPGYDTPTSTVRYNLAEGFGDNFNHYLIIKDEQNEVMHMYLNGVKVASQDNIGNSPFNVTPQLYIGRNPDYSANYYYEGKIDNIRVYNRVLSYIEIQALYQE